MKRKLGGPTLATLAAMVSMVQPGRLFREIRHEMPAENPEALARAEAKRHRKRLKLLRYSKPRPMRRFIDGG